MKKIIGSAALLLVFAACVVRAQPSSWEAMNRGLLHLLVYTIEIDPVDPLVMYAGTEYGNLYKSTDGGFNWVMSRNGIPANYNTELVSALHMDARDHRHLYAGFGGRASTKNLFESTDAGATWRTVTTPAGWQNAGVLHILKTSQGLFCGLGWSSGIAVLREGSSNWVISGTSGVQCLAAQQDHPQRMFYGASCFTPIFRSDDAGYSWHRLDSAFSKQKYTSGVRALSFSPAVEGRVYAGVTGYAAGLYYNVDPNGMQWRQLVAIDQISEIAVLPTNPDIIYISAIGTGVSRTLDGGRTWTRIMDGLPTTDVMRVRIAPGWPVRVFAVTLKHGIFRMVDEEITREKAGVQ